MWSGAGAAKSRNAAAAGKVSCFERFRRDMPGVMASGKPYSTVLERLRGGIL